MMNALYPSSQNLPGSYNPFQPIGSSNNNNVNINMDGPFGLGIIRRIGTKITNTAEFFAEMVRNTVKVITGGLNRL